MLRMIIKVTAGAIVITALFFLAVLAAVSCLEGGLEHLTLSGLQAGVVLVVCIIAAGGLVWFHETHSEEFDE